MPGKFAPIEFPIHVLQLLDKRNASGLSKAFFLGCVVNDNLVKVSSEFI